jgi:hypothetical protein
MCGSATTSAKAALNSLRVNGGMGGNQQTMNAYGSLTPGLSRPSASAVVRHRPSRSRPKRTRSGES